MAPKLLERKHPQNKSLSEALSEDAPRKKAQKGLIDKRSTLIKATDEGIVQEPGATMRPTDEQLARINELTRRPVTADEVVAFPTLSCNDIPDRDDDQFSTQCVKDFAALEQPFSSVGKSFMLDHAYSVGNAVGRIFGVGTKKLAGANFLTNEVYIPNTESNQKLIEDIDFGINWAVSVGVVLGKDECSVCKSPFSSWGWWCSEGHDKGLSYDPKSEEVDSWGYPLPCDPTDKNAVKCVRIFSEPRDLYELSQVFLGAQYYAALEKQPNFAAVMKSAAGGNVPIIGLSAEEGEIIPLRHEPKTVSDARIQFGISEMEDGSLKWVDDHGLQWTYNPANPDDGVMSLGRAVTLEDNDEEESDGEEEHLSASGSGDGTVDGEGQPVVVVPGAEGDAGAGGDQSSASGSGASGDEGTAPVVASADDDEDSDSEDEEESDEDDSEDEDEDDSEDDDESDEDDTDTKTATVEAVLAAARRAKLPEAVIDRISKSNKDGVSSLALAVALEIKGLQEKVSELTPKALLGDQYIESLQADALHWYTVSRQSKDGEPVKVESFQKLLDRIGPDADLLKDVAKEHQEEAQKKFPKAVRRSSFPTDPNHAEKVEVPEFVGLVDENDKKVSRLHS